TDRGAVHKIRRASITLLLLSACGSDLLPPMSEPPMTPPPEVVTDPVTEARALFPRALELHSGVIGRTCSPNPGVCHHTSNYPDLHTIGNVVALLGAPCN